MTIEAMFESLGEFAKDIRLNLQNLLTPDGAVGLSQKQIYMVALSSAYATHHEKIIHAFNEVLSHYLSPEEMNAAKIAAVLMAMNNVYYRFTHSVSDEAYASMPARLRMNAMANPGVAKIDFEVMALAVSAIHGCGYCMEAHTKGLIKAGATPEAVQSTIRLASVMHAAALALMVQ